MSKQNLQFIVSLLLWGILIAASLYLTHTFFAGDEWITFGLLLLSILSVMVLSELLTIWLLVLTIVIIVMIMVFGISYIPVLERAFYVILLPAVSLSTLRLFRLTYQLFVGDRTSIAKRAFAKLKRSKRQQSSNPILMVSWAHYEQFRESNPKESQRVLRKMRRRLRQQQGVREVYPLEDGLFLLFAEDGVDFSPLVQKLKEELEAIPFHNYKYQHAIQVRIAKVLVTKDEMTQWSFADLVKRLGRKLETEIVVEY